MKSRVTFSRYSIILTALLNVAMIAACIASFSEKIVFCVLLSLFLIMLISGLLYAPISIVANDYCIKIKSVLNSRKILIRDIESVELFKPTMGAIRLFASGGYMGYWGLFREGDIGRYMAYYGKASDCFIVKMKNGDKYVLGCNNPALMADFIKSAVRTQQKNG